jgi:putative membrane protein
MSATQGDLASLSKYIFRAPRWYTSVGFALVIAAFAGVASFDSRYVLEDAWQGIFFIGLPTVVASLLTTPLDRALGGQLTVKRSSLLALVCEMVVVAILTVAGVVVLLTDVPRTFVFDALVVALAMIFALRLLVVLAVSRNSWMVIAPASIQTLTAAVLLFVYSGTMRYMEIGGPILQSYLSRPERAPAELLLVTPRDFVVLAGLSVLYAGATYGLIRVIDRPWQRALDVSLLDFFRGFVGHVAEGTNELEVFFEEIGEEAVVPVTVLAFERCEDDTEKARFVLPMIHPGPMGEIGGGNLPARVAARSEGLAFPPHATAGHDFNLVTEAEVETLLDAAERAHDRIEYHETASESVRAGNGEATVVGQAFGDDALLVGTFSPSFVDDVEYAVGLSAAAEARSAGLEDVLLVDAHNSNNGLEGEHLGHVYPGSERSFQLMQAAREAAETLVEAPRHSLALGVAWTPTEWTPADGIGPLGIRVAVLDAGDQTTAYVLVDGNNMEPGLRDYLVDEVNAVDDVEVMTTDTHVVNTVESVNQVGGAIDDDELLDTVRGLVDQALDDREPVRAGVASERVAVTVFGNDRTETLASHANALMGMGGALVVAVVLAAVAVSLLVLLFT